MLPPNQADLQSGSCLTVSSRKLIQCRNNNCKIPPVATKTIEGIEGVDGGIPYSLRLPDATPGKYIISAVVNLGWCKANDGDDWIRMNDLYNDKIHDFEIKNQTNVEKIIKVTRFEPEQAKTGIFLHNYFHFSVNTSKTSEYFFLTINMFYCSRNIHPWSRDTPSKCEQNFLQHVLPHFESPRIQVVWRIS